MKNDRVISTPDEQAKADDCKVNLDDLKAVTGGQAEKSAKGTNESKGEEGDIVLPEI